MGYLLKEEVMNAILGEWRRDYDIFAPVCLKGKGAYAGTDVVRYQCIKDWSEIVFDKKAQFSFKEVLLPMNQTLFYFTEDLVTEENLKEKGNLVFLRSCDLHAVKRLDEIYLRNGGEDYYYKRIREQTRFILMGCGESFDSCFCVDMGTNQSGDYDLCVNQRDGFLEVDNQNPEWKELLAKYASAEESITPDAVSENQVSVTISDQISLDVMNSKQWEEYSARCINCGRCNFVCPTCTCFTMQDIFYTDNGKVGERKRVWASCMVDGFTDMAGNISFRQDNGSRMRFKVLHKVYDYKKRNGYHMCVGCGRCDDICPEYISFSNCVNKLEHMVEESPPHLRSAESVERKEAAEHGNE